AGAGVIDLRTLTTTARTGLLHREEALLHTHLTRTMTGITGFWFGAWLGATAVTGGTGGQGWNADLLLHTTHRFFQCQLHGVTQVRTTLRATTRATATTAKNIAKYITEN